ncbi:MAG: hypothetical protein ACI87E_000584 [Mariniblastus sp.]|jgi:hypothetical protein
MAYAGLAFATNAHCTRNQPTRVNLQNEIPPSINLRTRPSELRIPRPTKPSKSNMMLLFLGFEIQAEGDCETAKDIIISLEVF